MYRLLIVDDESHTRQQLKTAVNWELLQIRIVGEAQNGLEALTLAMEKKPDLVICDIRMPRMDGISFASGLLSHFPHTQFIFLSGYSDKMDMKHAIRLEAVDYIFKPFELSDLLFAVEKALERLKKPVPNPQPPADNDIVFRLLYQAALPGGISEFLQQNRLPLDFSQPWTAVLVRTDTGVSFSGYRAGGMPDSMELQTLPGRYFQDFAQQLAAIFSKRYLLSKGGNSLIVFANLPSPAENEMQLENALLPLLRIVKEAQTVIGISRCHTSPKDLSDAFREAREAAQTSFLSGYGKIYPFQKESFLHPFSPEHEAKNAVFSCLDRRKFSEASVFLEHYFLYLGSCFPSDIPAIREDTLQLSLSLQSRMKHPPFRFVGEFISRAATLEDIFLYLQYLLKQYMAESDQLDNQGRIIFEAESYILKHLDETLTVGQIAEHVFVSASYLCFLYKKRTGNTINKFILDARMKKAKSLLLDTGMKIGDIASSLGYANQNYFTKTFVSYYGTTPSSFRNHRL